MEIEYHHRKGAWVAAVAGVWLTCWGESVAPQPTKML